MNLYPQYCSRAGILILTGRNPLWHFVTMLKLGTTEEVETGMRPLHEHINLVFRDFFL